MCLLLHVQVSKDEGHRKGCRCRKSKCLKKYCECFQANVRCTDACRCGHSFYFDPAAQHDGRCRKVTRPTSSACYTWLKSLCSIVFSPPLVVPGVTSPCLLRRCEDCKNLGPGNPKDGAPAAQQLPVQAASHRMKVLCMLNQSDVPTALFLKSVAAAC